MEVKKAVASIPSSSEAQLNESDEYESNSEEEEIQRELADVSFEEIQKARSNGFVAIKAKVKQEKKGGRANKNRLMEISSKKPVRRHREVVQVPKKGGLRTLVALELIHAHHGKMMWQFFRSLHIGRYGTVAK